MLTDKKITFDSFIRGVLSILLIAGILFIIHRLKGVLLPFFIAWLAAYLMYPMVSFFQYRLRLGSRVLSIIVSMVLLLSVAALAFWIFVPPLLTEVIRLKTLALDYFAKDETQDFIQQQIVDFLHHYINDELLESTVNTQNILAASKVILPQLWSILTTSYSLIMAVFTTFITFLYLFFILLDYEKIADGWVELLPYKYRPVAIRLTTDVIEGMNSYFRGQALVAFIVGIIFSIGFLLIDFPLAIGLGLFIGLLNLVPYLQIIGVLPTMMLALLKSADTGTNFWYIFGLAMLVFVVAQIIQDALLVPKIMGKVTGLNPAIILLSLSIWGSLMGMIGMIIALPLTSLLLSYYQRYIRKNGPIMRIR